MPTAPHPPPPPAPAVMATNPATAPVHTPTVVGFLLSIQSITIHVMAATQVQRWVTRKALASRPSAVSPLPELNPNHPSHNRAAPINTKGTFCAGIGLPGL